MFQSVSRVVSDKMPVFSPDEYRIVASVGCAVAYFGFTKPQVAGLIAAATALILLVHQGMKALNFTSRPNFFIAISLVLSFLWVISSSLPAHAILEGVEQAIRTILIDDLNGEQELDDAITTFFTVLDLLIIFVLIGSVAFAIYQGSQSNDIRPILFSIAFVIGGIMVLEIGSRLILGVDDDAA